MNPQPGGLLHIALTIALLEYPNKSERWSRAESAGLHTSAARNRLHTISMDVMLLPEHHEAIPWS